MDGYNIGSVVAYLCTYTLFKKNRKVYRITIILPARPLSLLRKQRAAFVVTFAEKLILNF
jgi:hypothetical protein